MIKFIAIPKQTLLSSLVMYNQHSIINS